MGDRHKPNTDHIRLWSGSVRPSVATPLREAADWIDWADTELERLQDSVIGLLKLAQDQQSTNEHQQDLIDHLIVAVERHRDAVKSRHRDGCHWCEHADRRLWANLKDTP